MASKSFVHFHFNNIPENTYDSYRANVNTVACLYWYYTSNRVNMKKNHIHVCVIYIVIMITLQCNRNRDLLHPE